MGALLDGYAARGITITAQGDNLALDYQGELSANDVGSIQWDKPQLLDELRQPAAVSPAAQPPPNVILEKRRAFVVRELKAHPELPRTYHAHNAPLIPEAGEPVSVMLGIRGEDGVILTGELLIPRERFDVDALTRLMHAPLAGRA